MSRLGPEARALFKSARGERAPSDADRERVRRGLALRLGAAAGAVSTASSAAAVASSVSGGAASATGVAGPSAIALTTKWVGLAILAGALGAGGASVYVSQSRLPPDETSGADSRLDVAARRAPPPVGVASPPAFAPRAPVPPAAEEPAAPPRRWAAPDAVSASTEFLRAIAPEVTRQPAPPPAPGHSPADVASVPVGSREKGANLPSAPTAAAKETQLLRSADGAMRSGDARGALALLDEHARRFPHGVLAEERSAERVSALCALGRVSEARDEAARFLSATPDSPLAESVRTSCKGSAR